MACSFRHRHGRLPCSGLRSGPTGCGVFVVLRIRCFRVSSRSWHIMITGLSAIVESSQAPSARLSHVTDVTQHHAQIIAVLLPCAKFVIGTSKVLGHELALILDCRGGSCAPAGAHAGIRPGQAHQC